MEKLFPAATCFTQPMGNQIPTTNGWSTLLCKLRHNKLEENDISTYTKKLMNHLDILPGYDSGKMSGLWDESTIAQVQHLASKHYNLILWDVNEWERLSFCSTDVLKVDGSIVVFLQIRSEVESAIKEMNKETTAFVIGQYDAYLQLNPDNIKRFYSLTQPIFTMPYCSAFRNAADSRSTLDWYMRQSLRHNYTRRYSFIAEQERLTRFILERSGYHLGNIKLKVV